ncbi:MAG TPA: hypothetical protein VIV12_07455 [Streptosporangiaceae bacterium]
MRSPAGIMSIIYVINRWGLLPPVNPLMAFVPQLAFFLAHLLFGLIVGIVLAIAFRRPGVLGALPGRR